MADFNSTTQVEYRKIERFPGYRFGDDGSVWRKRRLTPWIQAGRPYVRLREESGSKRKSFLVYRLVLEAFRGPCPQGMQCRHLNGNPLDNRLENLAWGTAKENHEDMIRHGNYVPPPRNNVRPPHHRGETHPSAKLTLSQVIEIKHLKDAGLSQVVIGKKFGVSQQTVSNILLGRRWSD